MAFSLSAPVKTAVLNAWIKQIEEPAYHENPLLGFARKRGLIAYKPELIGTDLNWPVSYDQDHVEEIQGHEDTTTFNPPRAKLHAKIDWCGYKLGTRIDKLTKLINSGRANRIYDLVEATLKERMANFWEDIGLLMWNDYNHTGSGCAGVMSLIGASATITADRVYNGIGTYTPSTPADGVSPWWNCPPTGSYAGISMVPGNKINSWTGATDVAFPAGQFPTGYHFFTNLVGNYNSTYFTPSGGSATHSWDTQWQQAFNAVETYQQKLCKVPVDLWILDSDLLRRAKDSLIDNSRFVVTSTSEARSLGFPSVNYNGWELLGGYGVPDGMGVGFTFSKMSIVSLQPQFVTMEADRETVTVSDLKRLDAYFQMRFASPKYFPALVPATAAGT